MQIRLTTGKTIFTNAGESVLGALKRHGIYLTASCGGKGTCGKCRVRVIEGDAGCRNFGKLTQEERASGLVLACSSIPATEDLLIDIPESSRLVVGDKIATSRTEDMLGLLRELGGTISPIVSTVDLELPPPTIHDNIGDLERLKRALEELGITGVRFSHGFIERLAMAMREPKWNFTLGLTGAPPEAIYISPRKECCRYGIAVDIGTTTVVVYLVNVASGAILDMGLTYNSQIRNGDDVITRIVHATEGGGLDELRDAVRGDINDIISSICERQAIGPSEIESATIAGNTTMAHLFWGLDPGYIREEPYIPTLNSFPVWHAGTAGLGINPQAPVYTFPCVASYVGGDIVAGVLASKLNRSEEIALFMDIGTNGEIAVGNSDWLMTAACSAGPCFEGSGIRHGMRATEGAIESIRIEPATKEPAFTVVGGTLPRGICGSGMIDAISEMYLSGVIDQRGKLIREAAPKRIREDSEGVEYVFYEQGGVSVALTEPDIENILRAKAAIYAGVGLLLAEVGLTMDMIERVYIAGGFGNYLNVERAIILGMLPDLPRERFRFLGNTSVAGAYLGLLSSELREESEQIASKMTYMELSVSRGFMDEYMSALFLPHTDISRFPTVEALMKGRT